MDVAALVLWVLTALGGFVLLGTWLTQRNRAETQPSRIGPGMIFGHFLLAATGLVLWLLFVLGVGEDAMPWVGLVILLVVAALGFGMFFRWLGDRRAQTPPPTPEQRFPVVVVAAHGLAGAATLVLVALVALGITDG